MTRSSILVAASILGLCAIVSPPGCRTDSGAVVIDWQVAEVELRLAAADVRDCAVLVESEPLAADLVRLADGLDLAAQMLSESGATSASDALEAALNVAEQVAAELDGETGDSARMVVFAARAALRRMSAYAATDVPG